MQTKKQLFKSKGQTLIPLLMKMVVLACWYDISPKCYTCMQFRCPFNFLKYVFMFYGEGFFEIFILANTKILLNPFE